VRLSTIADTDGTMVCNVSSYINSTKKLCHWCLLSWLTEIGRVQISQSGNQRNDGRTRESSVVGKKVTSDMLYILDNTLHITLRIICIVVEI
jgi:hypothetical protein